MNFEDDLQRDVESGAATAGRDADAYRKIFAVLQKEPPFELSDAFADRVISRVTERYVPTSYRVEIAAWIVSVVLILSGGVYIVAVTNISFSLGFLNGLKPYLGLFAFGVVGVLIFQYFERRLVGKRI